MRVAQKYIHHKLPIRDAAIRNESHFSAGSIEFRFSATRAEVLLENLSMIPFDQQKNGTRQQYSFTVIVYNSVRVALVTRGNFHNQIEEISTGGNSVRPALNCNSARPTLICRSARPVLICRSTRPALKCCLYIWFTNGSPLQKRTCRLESTTKGATVHFSASCAELSLANYFMCFSFYF